MAKKWQGDEDDLEWVDELEAALILEATSSTDVLRLCKGKILPERLRPKVWQTCLNPEGKFGHVTLSEIFDLPEQSVLREDCQKFVANLGNDDEDKLSVISDLETILTTYRKTSGDHYERNNGWLEIMLPLLSLKRQQSETYSLFATIREKYVPHGCTNKKGDVFHLFRLLLLYHEPEICSFLDTKRITPDLYCSSWFQTLFSANCNLKVVLAMWDLYFQQADPYFLFFLALVMVVNAKDQILEMEKLNKEDVIEMLSVMPSALEIDDVSDFCSLAQYYALKTPSSFRVDLEDALFGIRNKSSNVSSPVNSPTGNKVVDGPSISQALCLPVSAQELVDNVSATATSLGLSPDSNGQTLDVVRFFLVDCRPVEQYNAGHLPTAFHLDCNLMLQEPAAFSTAVQGLLSAQRKALAARSAAGGEHLCFLGSGRNEEDQYTHMVVASFLQKHTHFVSMLSGGYEAIHHYLSDNLSENFEHHNPQSCLVCLSNTPASTPSSSNTLKSYPSTVDIFSKFSAAVSKIKAAEVKGKLLDYIVNPTSSTHSRTQADRHVSANDKLGRRYRNVSPVFSIDDEEPDHSNYTEKKEESNQREIIHLSQWTAEHPVVASFYCQEIKVNRMQYDSMLMLTDTHLYLLRTVPGGVDSARVVAKRALESIVKITSRRKQPEIVTFKYGYHEDDLVTVTDMDRLYIPEGKEATLAVVNQVKILIKKAEGKEEIEEPAVANSLHENSQDSVSGAPVSGVPVSGVPVSDEPSS